MTVSSVGFRCMTYFIRLHPNYSWRAERKLRKTLQQQSNNPQLRQSKSVRYLPANRFVEFVRSVTDETSLPEEWFRKVKLSVSLPHSRSVSRVPSLHSVHFTSVVLLRKGHPNLN